MADLCPVMLFSGKGGVGKTTLAAATAVRLARGGSRVLILSTDPAHNLSDVFDTPLSSRPREILPGLDAMELDARGLFAEALGPETEGQGGLKGLMRLATDAPGIDEFGAIEVLLRVMEQAEHDLVILDTAPTGHTLRLLMVPELLDGWFGTMLELRDRIARAGRLLRRFLPGTKAPSEGDLARDLEGGRKRITALRDVLTDDQKSQIILVTIPEALSVLETTRTLQMLASHAMTVGTIVVNQLQPANPGCPHCARRREIHESELALMRRNAGATPVRVVESQPTAIRGADALEGMARLLWGDT
ncbi:MAG: ArsA family ATPase [Deltaproteobacteria bacterium]|nr:ArsA family ATPase [Deltaproteobacteria bacterium]